MRLATIFKKSSIFLTNIFRLFLNFEIVALPLFFKKALSQGKKGITPNFFWNIFIIIYFEPYRFLDA